MYSYNIFKFKKNTLNLRKLLKKINVILKVFCFLKILDIKYFNFKIPVMYFANSFKNISYFLFMINLIFTI